MSIVANSLEENRLAHRRDWLWSCHWSRLTADSDLLHSRTCFIRWSTQSRDQSLFIIVADSLCREESTCSAKRSTIDWCHWSRLTRRKSTSSAKRLTIDWCHWSRLTDRLAHWRDRLWARHCSRLTSCTWMYDQIHWWVEWWERIDHRFDDVIEADSLRDLLIEIETSRSSRLISLIALWNRDFTQS